MKPNYLFTGILATTAMVVVSCSTPKLANRTAMQDDVYHSVAQAREYRAVEPIQITTDSADYYGSDEPNYDMDYSSRINRFYYASPWRTYYDDYYGYNPYSFNAYYSPYGWGFGLGFNYGFNNWYNPYSNWAYYGSPYYGSFWGPYSYYNPYYGGGFLGGGHWGGGFIGNIVSRPNNPRPSRGSENNIYRGNGANGNPSSSRPIGSTAGRSRAEMYNPSNNGTSNARPNSSSNARPTRGDNGSSARPTRTSEAPPPRPSYTPPPASSNSGGGRSSGSGSSSSGSARPTRGGGR